MLSQQLKSKTKGFTIIEVLIVLAIAGLILLIVFLAVPALQRNQRNNARNTEAARFSALVTECLANRNGTNASCMSNASIGVTPATDFRELGGTIVYVNGGTTSPTPSTTALAVWHQSLCNTTGAAAVASTSNRDFSVIYTLEPAVTRCIDSQ